MRPSIASWRASGRNELGDPHISEYQVRQTSAGAEVLVVGSPEVAAVRTSLTTALRNHGLANPDVRVSTVTQIERHAATGKLKRFIALDTPP